jgi:ankyrin repeat protein
MAVINTRFDLAGSLIKLGADPNKWDLWGRTPLYAAVDLNTIPRGGRPDRPSLDETTSLQIVEMLLDAGANPNAQLKLAPPFRNIGNDRGLDGMLTTGATPLLRAAKALDAAAIRVLLAKGADLKLANTRAMTPLMAAAGLGSVDADTRGIYTTEDVQKRSIESLTLLLEAGGDINAKDSRGLTPLHEAARWGWNDVVKFLVVKGANLDAKDNRGMTPVDSALGKAGGNSRGGQRIDVHEDTAELLLKLKTEK